MTGNAIELPSQGAKEFPRFLDGGIATENTDPAAYRATHSYLFSFAGSDTVYTLTVAGSAHEVDLLRNTLTNVFIILFFVILIIATLASMIYSRYVTRPVLRLSAVSKNMSELNFNWKCEEDRTDELGVLAHSLNEMSKKLSAALENLQAANIKLQADIEHEKELEQAQLDFFSAVSHELKTPITIIKGQTEGMILNVGDYQDRNKYLSRSLEIINTMESMVQEILTVSRMKSSKVGLRKEKMDFSDLLKREYALFEDLIVQKEIDWNENISPALQIVADKMLIQKAINNIVSNAILYSPRGSSIYMDAFSKNGSVVFQIENTGVHIPEAEIPKLFDAFYRMEQSRNRKTGGSGLGLYIVKTILEQHNIIYSLKTQTEGYCFQSDFEKYGAVKFDRPVFLTTHKKHIRHNGIPNSSATIYQKQKGVFQNMKKQKITTLLLTMALCASAVLSGCAASAASQTEPNQSTTSSTPFEEAKDSGTPISSDEASSVQAYENDEVFPLRNRPKRSKNAGLRLLKSILSMNRMA